MLIQTWVPSRIYLSRSIRRTKPFAFYKQIFGTPRSHPKSKPFIDRVMSFHWIDDKVWIRNWQVGLWMLHPHIMLWTFALWTFSFENISDWRNIGPCAKLPPQIIFPSASDCWRRQNEATGEESRIQRRRPLSARRNRTSSCLGHYSDIWGQFWWANFIPKSCVCFAERNSPCATRWEAHQIFLENQIEESCNGKEQQDHSWTWSPFGHF